MGARSRVSRLSRWLAATEMPQVQDDGNGAFHDKPRFVGVQTYGSSRSSTYMRGRDSNTPSPAFLQKAVARRRS